MKLIEKADQIKDLFLGKSEIRVYSKWKVWFVHLHWRNLWSTKQTRKSTAVQKQQQLRMPCGLILVPQVVVDWQNWTEATIITAHVIPLATPVASWSSWIKNLCAVFVFWAWWASSCLPVLPMNAFVWTGLPVLSVVHISKSSLKKGWLLYVLGVMSIWRISRQFLVQPPKRLLPDPRSNSSCAYHWCTSHTIPHCAYQTKKYHTIPYQIMHTRPDTRFVNPSGWDGACSTPCFSSGEGKDRFLIQCYLSTRLTPIAFCQS